MFIVLWPVNAGSKYCDAQPMASGKMPKGIKFGAIARMLSGLCGFMFIFAIVLRLYFHALPSKPGFSFSYHRVCNAIRHPETNSSSLFAALWQAATTQRHWSEIATMKYSLFLFAFMHL